MTPLRIAIVTCSNSRSAGIAEDTAGPALTAECEARGWDVVGLTVVPDEVEAIVEAIESSAGRGYGRCRADVWGNRVRSLRPHARSDASRVRARGSRHRRGDSRGQHADHSAGNTVPPRHCRESGAPRLL